MSRSTTTSEANDSVCQCKTTTRVVLPSFRESFPEYMTQYPPSTQSSPSISFCDKNSPRISYSSRFTLKPIPLFDQTTFREYSQEPFSPPSPSPDENEDAAEDLSWYYDAAQSVGPVRHRRSSSAYLTTIYQTGHALHSTRRAISNPGIVGNRNSWEIPSSELPAYLPHERARSRKYACHVCHKEFDRPSSLSTHVNIHTGAKPHKCLISGCDSAFAAKSNMHRHVRQVHGLDVVAAVAASTQDT